MKTVLYEATGDLVAKFSVHLRPVPPGTKLPEIEMRVRQATPTKLSPNSHHLFADKRIVLGDGGEFEIWGRIPQRRTRQFGKRRHRRGWCAL